MSAWTKWEGRDFKLLVSSAKADQLPIRQASVSQAKQTDRQKISNDTWLAAIRDKIKQQKLISAVNFCSALFCCCCFSRSWLPKLISKCLPSPLTVYLERLFLFLDNRGLPRWLATSDLEVLLIQITSSRDQCSTCSPSSGFNCRSRLIFTSFAKKFVEKRDFDERASERAGKSCALFNG